MTLVASLLALQLAADAPATSLPYSPSLDLTALDRSTDACTDFYQYSCGGWMKLNPIPSDQPSWSVYSKLAQDNQRFLWGILDDLTKPVAGRTDNQRKLGDFFASCMDEPAIEAKGAKPLQFWLAQIAALESVYDLGLLVAKLQLANLGFYHDEMLFSFGSEPNPDDASQVVADLGAGGLGLPDRDYYTRTDSKSKEQQRQYLAHVQAMLQLLGDGATTAAQEAKTVYALEERLARASLTLVEKRDPHNLFHKLTRDELEKLVPAFDWDAYFTTLVQPKLATLQVEQPGFENELQKALTAVPLADWKTYLRWHTVHAMAPYLSKAFVDADFGFYQHVLRGVPEIEPRWKRCVKYTDEMLGEALGQEFVRRTFTPETERLAADMTRRIEQAMEADLRALDWMSAKTKNEALTKLHGINNKIGYPQHWRDYGALTITRNDFATNVALAQTFETSRWILKIGRPVDKSEWFMTPPTVNAYYDGQINDINFPAGVLQPPLFDVKLDDAPNYGDTGSTIGHELTHAFDDEGRQFDSKGNLRDWWTKDDERAFGARAQCIVDQYAKYVVVDDIKINSKLTEGEDIADLGGTRLAYDAWKQAEAGKTLPNRDGFTPDQRFFIGLAQWACQNQRAESLRERALTNPHSPARYRINGVVANLPAFQQAFSCKAGSPMVNPKPCRVW